MEKVYSIENLDCANCAAKAEDKIRKIPGVKAASITFATMQLRLTADDPDALLPLALQAAREIEPDIQFLPDQKEHHHEDCCHEAHHDGCSCGHKHHHHHEKNEFPGILLGTGLFAVALVISILWPSLFLHIPLFITAYVVLGWEVLSTAGKNIIKGKFFDENFLMSIATLGAFAIGEFAEAVGVMLFYRIGEYFEHKAMERSRSQIMEAVDLRPEVVTLTSGKIIAAADACPGDLLVVRPGDRIPLDGTVISGTSRIDTAPITGEPIPVSAKPGDCVISGCVNLDGLLTLQVEKSLSDSMVSRILNAVENAAAGKPRIDRFITRFARVYTPIVVALAVATAVIPSLIWGNWGYWVYTALSFLVMSCPCALVLSVPLAFFCGIGTGSKKGILFKSGLSIEALAGVKTVVMDKTGTLTKGDFSVQRITGDENTLMLCASCEQFSSHPIAASILTAAREASVSLQQPEQVEEIPGHGIRAVLGGQEVLCGNEKLLAQFGISPSETIQNGNTVVYVACDGRYSGAICIADTIKPDAADSVARLKGYGVSAAMLTGDQLPAARAVANAVGIQDVHAQLLPQEKLEILQKIRDKDGAAMFVGDGINDAPVLAGADVGAAMGSGADAAIEAADVVFMTSQVSAIADALSIARQTKKIAWQNVIFALSVKLLVMVLGLLGFASMWAAVFADSGVAMLCVLNAIRLLYRKDRA